MECRERCSIGSGAAWSWMTRTVCIRNAGPRGRVDAAVTVWRLLRRHHVGTRRARLAVLERISGATTGLLTERTVKRIRHVGAAVPGDLVSLDTFYVGKPKGVGKVWQITACDVAASFA
jgi:hypothetical protein